MVENKKTISKEDIANLFGLRSVFYLESIKYLNKKAISKKEIFEDKFQQWKNAFENIYGASVEKELFIKHTFFALMLKSLIIIKLSKIQNLDYDDAYDDCISNNLEFFNIFELDNYFYWTDFNRKLFEKIYAIIEFTKFAQEDLFLDIYQQVFFSVTRHKIGEFYTPSKLVQLMVDDSYQFGEKVLDPSCGSGNYLIDIILKILNSEMLDVLKIKAINKVYGFDINPLATMTTKVNIFLIFLEYFAVDKDRLPNINIFLIDSLFPEQFENVMNLNLKKLYNSFDLIIGNPPWLTYKDLNNKQYQIKIRELANELQIKPSSNYITHIELATLFFYFIPFKFLKVGGKIFFVITKSVLNGDHCYKFRSFSLFKDLEIWDFPKNYFFNIQHICLKAEYIGKNTKYSINSKYPIKTKIFNKDLRLKKETLYSSLKIGNVGARIIFPKKHLKILNNVSNSQYRNMFYQGATLVPRTLVFFKIEEKSNNNLRISTDNDILSRAKQNWKYNFLDRDIEPQFRYKTFLNKDLIPFLLKNVRNVFLPIDDNYKFNLGYLEQFPKALKFYNSMNEVYQNKKKKTSDIESLFDNLNYWNKLTKQVNNRNYMIVYNASGSNIKAAVINNRRKKLIIGSENYYYPTSSKEEAYYLSAILNAPIMSRNLKLIKSSRHIHKRPFSFPIPQFDDKNEDHHALVKRALKCESIALDLFMKNPNINTDKLKIIIHQKLNLINELVEKVVFKH